MGPLWDPDWIPGDGSRRGLGAWFVVAAFVVAVVAVALVVR